MFQDIDIPWAMKETLLLANGPYGYKNGAFAGAVTPATSVIDDFNVMISSPLVTAHEKLVFEKAKNLVVRLRNMKARGEEPDNLQFIKDCNCAFKLEKVLSADMKARVACYEEVNSDPKKEANSSKRHEPKVATAESEKAKPSQSKPQQSARFAGFGKAFEGNLKNAFL
ncbi:hypothetical protein G7Y79_00003g010840 [Physcia stellaris]|nr:hypothetical protein G7Y79_00003g010840 [Physcia stellaris]